MSFHLFIFWGDYFATHFLVAIGDKQLRSQQACRWHLFPYNAECNMENLFLFSISLRLRYRSAFCASFFLSVCTNNIVNLFISYSYSSLSCHKHYRPLRVCEKHAQDQGKGGGCCCDSWTQVWYTCGGIWFGEWIFLLWFYLFINKYYKTDLFTDKKIIPNF